MTTPSVPDGSDHHDLIVGREKEIAEITTLIDQLSERGAALIVRGEAGIGKSALIQVAVQQAMKSGSRVRQVTGVQSETKLPFAGLHQIVLPLLGDAHRLPTPQRMALMAAFGMLDNAEPPDRFLIGLATLELLSDAAESTSLVVVADDAQWLDASTAAVLAFVARRLEHEPIGMLMAVRDGEADALADSGLPVLELGGLSAGAAEEVLATRAGGLAPDVHQRILDEAAGNPLALIELPATLSEDELVGTTIMPSQLPLTTRLERAFAGQAVSLPEATQALLLVAAVSDGQDALNDLVTAAQAIRPAAAAREAASALETLTPALDARLLEVDGQRVEFRHPLMRSAVYQAASEAERRAAHAALAEVLDDQDDRALWHRAASVEGTDEQVAAALEEAAMRARRRGALDTAVSALRRAADISGDAASKEPRLLEAAELAMNTSRRHLAQRLFAKAESLELSPAGRQRAVFLRRWFLDGAAPSDRELIAAAEAAEHLGSSDKTAATNMLQFAAGVCTLSSPGHRVRDRIVAASRRVPQANDPTLVLVRALASPQTAGTEFLDVMAALPPDGQVDEQTMRLSGIAACNVGDFDLAVALLSSSADTLRAQGRIALLAQTLLTRAYAYCVADQWTLAESDLHEGRRLAASSSHPAWSTRALTVEAHLAAVQGEFDRAVALADEAEQTSLRLDYRVLLTQVQWTRGLIALGEGRHLEAYEYLARVFDPDDAAWHYCDRHLMIGDLVEAAVQSERVDAARSLLLDSEAEVRQIGSPAGLVAVAYGHAMLAEGDAELRFGDALDLVRSRRPFTRARLQLARGILLRRERRVMESRGPLRVARETFDALGARTWADRARRELRASGVESRPRAPGATDDLTPQELQIARLAAAGLSNREIGAQLFLSHRTVSAHLYRAFPKLGVTSRSQLGLILDPSPS